MVTILIIGLTPTGETREFAFFAKLEVVLEQLNYLINSGENVIQAYLIDQRQRLELPLAAFDGQPFLAPLQELERQWQFILGGPQSVDSIHTRYMLELTRKKLLLYESRKEEYEQISDYINQLNQRALTHLPEGIVKQRQLNRYATLIARNEATLARLRTNCKLTQERLDQLRHRVDLQR